MVTGGTGGIGRAVAVQLAAAGHRVLFTGRDPHRAAAVLNELRGRVCCAGVLATVPEYTREGLERTLVLNYLSRHLLVRGVEPLLRASSSGRVVLVANAGRYRDTPDLDDLQHRRHRQGLRIAGRTQLAPRGAWGALRVSRRESCGRCGRRR